MLGKKKTLGFEPKVRTAAEVSADYRKQAMEVGFKALLLRQIEDRLQNVQNELDSALQKLLLINEEGLKLPKEETPSKNVQ